MSAPLPFLSIYTFCFLALNQVLRSRFTSQLVGLVPGLKLSMYGFSETSMGWMNGKFTCGTKAFQWVVGHRALSPKDSFTKNGDVAFERHGPFQGYRVKWKSTSLPPFFPWLYVCKTQMLEEEKNIEVVKSISSLVFRSHKSPSVNNDVMKY